MEVSAGEKCDKCTVKRQNQSDGVIIVPRCALVQRGVMAG